MKLFRSFLSKITSPISSPQMEKPIKREPMDTFQLIDQMENGLLQQLRQSYRGRIEELCNNTLTIWITDDIKRNLLIQCHDRLLTNLRDNSGLPITDIVFKGGEIPSGATKFYDDFAFTVGSPNIQVSSALQATISILDGNGTLMQSEYVINANGGKYPIGRGSTEPNAISIVADPSDLNHEKNKYVRSHHAYIEYLKDVGFCLFVEKDGTQIYGGSRTQICRANEKEPLELNNPMQPIPLHDSDIIVLGKSVKLKWSSKQ